MGEQRRPGEEQRLRLYYMHLRPEKPRTMCLRHGQLRTGLPPAFSAGRRGGGGRVKGRRRGAGKVNFKEGTDKKVNNRDLNHSGHLELQPLFPPPLPSSGTSSSYFRMF